MKHTGTLTRVLAAVLALTVIAVACSSSSRSSDGAADATVAPIDEPTVAPIEEPAVEPTLNPTAPTETVETEPTSAPQTVQVVWADEGDTMSIRDRSDQALELPEWSTRWEDDLLTIILRGDCGDECSSEHVLVLHDGGTEPEFISYTYNQVDWEADETFTQSSTPAVDRLVVHLWDRAAGRFAGRLFGADPDRSLIAFYFDNASPALLDRLDRGEELPVDLLRSGLTSGDAARELDALLALNQLGGAYPEFSEELFDLLAGGEGATEEVAIEAAFQLSRLLSDDRHLGLRRPMPVYWVVDTTELAHREQVRLNWESLLAVGTADGVAGRDLTDDESLIAGSYETFEFNDCGPEPDWNESCGLAITLLCNGYAFWNAGVTIETSPWELREGVLTFDGPQPNLDGLVDEDLSVGGWIEAKREGYSDWRRCG